MVQMVLEACIKNPTYRVIICCKNTVYGNILLNAVIRTHKDKYEVAPIIVRQVLMQLQFLNGSTINICTSVHGLKGRKADLVALYDSLPSNKEWEHNISPMVSQGGQLVYFK